MGGGASKARWAPWLSVGLTVVLLAAAVGVVVTDDDADDGATQEAEASTSAATAPVIVTLSGPGDRRIAAGATVEITVEAAAAAPIDRLEVWNGERLVLAETTDLPGSEASTSVALEPTEGPHVIVGRAIDAEGNVGQSAPTWIEVVQPSLLAEVDEGGEAADEHASGQPSQRWASPSRRSVALAPAAAASQEAARQAVPVVRVDGCRVDVEPPAAGEWTSLSVAPETSSAFLPLPVSGVADVQAPAGLHVFTAVGPAGPSGIAVAEVPAECSTDLWSGDVRLERGRLIGATADRAYLYLREDGGPWQRVPAGDQTFVTPSGDGTFDFDGLLPSLVGSDVDLEAWGWRDGSLAPIGEGHLEVPAADATAVADLGPAGFGTEVLGGTDAVVAGLLRTDLDWIVARESSGGSAEIQVPHPEVLAREGTLMYDEQDNLGPEGQWGAGDPELEFRWDATDPSATHAILQVSSVPPPPGPDLDYPGLLAFLPMEGGSGEVTIDIEAVWKGFGLEQDVVDAIPYTDLAPVPLALADEPVVADTADDSEASAVHFPPSLFAELAKLLRPTGLFVRVVPMAGTQPIDHASNVVTFGVGPEEGMELPAPPPQAPQPDIESAAVEFFPPGPPNGAYEHCVRVIENPNGDQNVALIPLFQSQYDEFEPAGVGDTICADYDPPEEHWYDVVIDAVEFVADVWDEVVGFVNDLKNKLVELAAMFGCKQWAEIHWSALSTSAKEALADQGVDGPMDLCTTMIGTAVDVYLAANGIPPTLPTSDEALAGVKGDLAEMVAAQVASACPGALSEECKEQAAEYVEQLIDLVQEDVSNSTKQAAAAGDWDLLLGPEVVVVPEPAGQFRPAMFQITLELATPAAEDMSCGWLGTVTGSHPGWTYRKPVNAEDIVEVTEPISGPVMAPATGSVHIPAGATSAVGTVVLPHLDRYWHPIPADTWNSDPFWWAWFDPEAQLTMRITGCGMPSNGRSEVIPAGMHSASSTADVPLP